MSSDRELIAAYLDGDEAAFEAFYRRHRRPVFVYLLSRRHGREVAEELLQETFMAFLKGVDRLHAEREDLRPLLVRIARNLTIDSLRRKRRGQEALEKRLEDPLFRSRATGAWEAQSADGNELSELLYRLPDEQREAVVLRALVGMTFVEIGRLLEVSENTVVSRYRYGTAKLRAALAKGGCGERAG